MECKCKGEACLKKRLDALEKKFQSLEKLVNVLDHRTIGEVRLGPSPYDLSAWGKKA